MTDHPLPSAPVRPSYALDFTPERRPRPVSSWLVPALLVWWVGAFTGLGVLAASALTK